MWQFSPGSAAKVLAFYFIISLAQHFFQSGSQAEWLPRQINTNRRTGHGCPPLWKDFISAEKCCEQPGSIPCRNLGKSPQPRRGLSHPTWTLFIFCLSIFTKTPAGHGVREGLPFCPCMHAHFSSPLCLLVLKVLLSNVRNKQIL